jgi:threonine/homoserine/homoserine lactone efflux protein
VALSAVTTYTVVESSLLTQVLALAGIALVVTVGAVTTWTLFGAMLRRYLHTDRRRRWFNYAMAALLVASIVPVFWE